MKSTLTILVSVIFLTSCERCYECTTPMVEREFCKDDYQYDMIKNGVQLNDEFGNDMECHKK